MKLKTIVILFLFGSLLTACAPTIVEVQTVTRIVEVTRIVSADEVVETPDIIAPEQLDGENQIAGCPVFPADNIWNVKVDELPVHPQSEAYIRSIGADGHLHPDFGSGTWEGEPIGIPFNIVSGERNWAEVAFDYEDESDPGPYPIPIAPLIEGGPDSDGDRHILVLDAADCMLYEIWYAWPDGEGGWWGGSGAVFDLRSNALRPDGWTSSDAAGLPVLPGLIRYEEIENGVITHAIRFTAEQTQQAYVWPARHYASEITDTDVPPMGMRFRLKADYDISGYSPEVQIILQAMKDYGLILADNGGDWFISGTPDDRWDNEILAELKAVPGSAFEAVDVSNLMVSPDSGQVSGP